MSGDGARIAYPLFQEEDGGSHPTSPLQLKVNIIELDLARRLNKLWHSRLPETNEANLIRSKDHINFGAHYGGKWFASAIWTSPIARHLNGLNILELRRFAIAPDAPVNTASRLLSVMVKIIKKKLPHIVMLISYQDTEVHSGTIYKASGWSPGRYTKVEEIRWGKLGRKRNPIVATGPKIRWEKDL